ncbi:MAG: SHOCT domain-containing protein [Solirubrobacteraceae bacterium]|nr:SHOCT domain-containing protein [Solirubrobacteraceae bacterium]
MQRRQAEKFADRDASIYAQREQAYEQQVAPAAAPPPPAPPAATAVATDSLIDQLQKLGDLKTQGILTDAEFEAQKAKILGEL